MDGWTTQIARVPHSIAHVAIEWGHDAAEVEGFPNKKPRSPERGLRLY
jgi:hypothetical protein